MSVHRPLGTSVAHPPPHLAVVASAGVWSPAFKLQAGPVLSGLVLKFHPPARSRHGGREGPLVHVLKVLAAVEVRTGLVLQAPSRSSRDSARECENCWDQCLWAFFGASRVPFRLALPVFDKIAFQQRECRIGSSDLKKCFPK